MPEMEDYHFEGSMKDDPKRRFSSLITKLGTRKVSGLVMTLVLAIMLPVVLVAVQMQQNFRQRAATMPITSPITITTTSAPTPPPTGGIITTAPTTKPDAIIKGQVFIDNNRNGILDKEEWSYAYGAEVRLSNGQKTTADSSGLYYFYNLPAGTYQVTLVSPQSYGLTSPNPVNVSISASTASEVVNFGLALLPTSTPTPTTRLTPTPTPSSAPRYTITGYLFTDANRNKVKDWNEDYYRNGAVLFLNGKKTTTDSQGKFSYTELIAETYQLSLSAPTTYSFTSSNPINFYLKSNIVVTLGIAPLPTSTPTAVPTKPKPSAPVDVVTPSITNAGVVQSYNPWAVWVSGSNFTPSMQVRVYDSNGTTLWGNGTGVAYGGSTSISFSLPANSPPSRCNASTSCYIYFDVINTQGGGTSAKYRLLLPVNRIPIPSITNAGVVTSYNPWVIWATGTNMNSPLTVRVYDNNGATLWGYGTGIAYGSGANISFSLPSNTPPSNCNATTSCTVYFDLVNANNQASAKRAVTLPKR